MVFITGERLKVFDVEIGMGVLWFFYHLGAGVPSNVEVPRFFFLLWFILALLSFEFLLLGEREE